MRSSSAARRLIRPELKQPGLTPNLAVLTTLSRSSCQVCRPAPSSLPHHWQSCPSNTPCAMGVCLERGVGDVTCMKGFVPGNLLAHQGAKLEPQCFCAASGCVLWMIPPEEATEEALGSTWEDDSSTAAGPKPPFEVGVSPLPQQPCVEAFECQVAGFCRVWIVR